MKTTEALQLWVQPLGCGKHFSLLKWKSCWLNKCKVPTTNKGRAGRRLRVSFTASLSAAFSMALRVRLARAGVHSKRLTRPLSRAASTATALGQGAGDNQPGVGQWMQLQDADARPFYHCLTTGRSVYEVPASHREYAEILANGRACTPLRASTRPKEPVWIQHETESKQPYFFNPQTGTSTWQLPHGAAVKRWQPSQQLQGREPVSESPASSAPADGKSTPAGAGGSGGGGWWQSFASKYLYKEAIVAPDGYNRWLNVPASVMVQLSIGSVYAWSIFNSPLTRELGVVAPAADDWTLSAVVPIFSVCALTLGACTAGLGKWAERVGPRMVAGTAALCWGGGLAVTALGCAAHQLPLLYLGYGVLGGLGWGLGYISPVSTLLRWFPDRKGLAAGLALTAFGGGAMVATPLNEALLQYFSSAPAYLGPVDELALVTDAGKRFVETQGGLREVVVATARDVAAFSGDLPPGVYEVGTGDTGARNTFLTLAALHTASMLVGAAGQRVPAPGWTPPGYVEPQAEAGQASGGSPNAAIAATGNVDPDEALRTPQFYMLWAAVAGNAIAGVSVISCAKTLMTDCFSTALPGVVTAGFAATYVAALSGANMMGRFGWSFASDFLGRKNTYGLFSLGIPTVLALPALTSWVSTDASLAPLVLFYGGTWLVVSFYGGVFSVLPAYLSDLFGQKHVGAIHGRLLTAWAAAAAGGPALLAALRSSSERSAVAKLVEAADESAFREHFGAGKEELEALLAAKSVNISQLMQVVPPGTVDPTPTLNNNTMYAMAGLLTVAMACNAGLRRIDPKHYIENKAPAIDVDFRRVDEAGKATGGEGGAVGT